MSVLNKSAVAFLLALGFGVAPHVWAQEAKPNAMAHEAEGRAQCLMCHTAGVMEPVPDVPASHAERPNETCLWCHAPDAKMLTVTPKVIPHDLAGRDACLMCHTPGAMEPIPDAPADHDGRGNEFCGMCHTAAES
jgi:hypothetical protein